MAPDPQPEVIAAVDLGSNSFHMVVARRGDGEITILDRIREMVRLGAGLDEQGRIQPDAAELALACLARFRERLAALEAGQVRAVGTNTLRRARRRAGFLRAAREALGHPIEVISGVEEARLVYLGAARSLPAQTGRRLVVDIGGGSTELIVGEGYDALRLESLYMGCVSSSEAFFPGGVITAEGFRQARLFARRELEPIRKPFRQVDWQQAVGTSGTIRATGRVLRLLGATGGEITREGLEVLRERLLAAGDVKRHDLPGLGDQRAPVYPGGLAVLTEIFAALDLDQMVPAEGALREGLLWDLLGRLTDEDARDRSVRAFQQRFHADATQAERVEATALGLLEQLAGDWSLEDPECADLLGWGARLHEVGLDIAHAQHQLHAAYLLRHADLAGFSSDQQQRLAGLVGAHRRKIRKGFLDDVQEPWSKRLPYLVAILRLAVLLHRSRSDKPLPALAVEASRRKLRLQFPESWLETHPLTLADLEQEARYLGAIDLKLSFR
ncbi:exopolyphosphatase [Thioalkalivibrio sp. XN8]|uniref:exopolyphosphatase n=1 Tax=Thioalkalivibrio sp. XN8 TaxID=2712863 RepID=UPI0013EC51F9|nr:exopolyphosphatase [Thioalkalivibrio sp. XN8]NGP52038.1 exopolyphosphatase [Thioalkalivibrio sp. XN8]